MTIRTALIQAWRELRDASDAPHLDAERLLLHALGRDESSWLYAHVDGELTDEQAQRFDELVAERASGKPLAYILGWQEFYGRRFIVTPDVLIPRPATEQLVEAALTYLRSFDISKYRKDKPYVIADIGTGSGCIAVTLALELESGIENRELRIIATDISAEALSIAQHNAQRHGVADRIEFVQGDMLAPFDFAPTSAKATAGRQGKPLIDLIVSNPPYVPTAELDSPKLRRVQSKIETVGLAFEPRLALDGGADGLQYIRQLKIAGIPAIVEGLQGTIMAFAAGHRVTS